MKPSRYRIQERWSVAAVSNGGLWAVTVCTTGTHFDVEADRLVPKEFAGYTVEHFKE
jgi:hypothetical protein